MYFRAKIGGNAVFRPLEFEEKIGPLNTLLRGWPLTGNFHEGKQAPQ